VLLQQPLGQVRRCEIRAPPAAAQHGSGQPNPNASAALLDGWRGAAIDADSDGRLDRAEFIKSCAGRAVGLDLPAAEAGAAFDALAAGKGSVLFAAFCAWCARQHVGDEYAVEGDPRAAAARAPASASGEAAEVCYLVSMEIPIESFRF
jgi:hypothetical protein